MQQTPLFIIIPVWAPSTPAHGTRWRLTLLLPTSSLNTSLRLAAQPLHQETVSWEQMYQALDLIVLYATPLID